METLLINFRPHARRVTEGGREYLVAPMSLINPGVLPGSKGPLLYTPEDTQLAAESWNHVPITVYHPTEPLTNRPLSATAPGVLDRQGIGEVRKAAFLGKLRAEGWFDIERTRKIDPRIYNSLIKGEMLELSTGLFTDNEPAAPGSNHNGRGYDYIARAHRPDHLAVLPDQVGACSLRDGCGVLVNSRQMLQVGEWIDVVTNKWTDEARKAALETRKRKPKVSEKPSHSPEDLFLSDFYEFPRTKDSNKIGPYGTTYQVSKADREKLNTGSTSEKLGQFFHSGGRFTSLGAAGGMPIYEPYSAPAGGKYATGRSVGNSTGWTPLSNATSGSTIGGDVGKVGDTGAPANSQPTSLFKGAHLDDDDCHCGGKCKKCKRKKRANNRWTPIENVWSEEARKASIEARKKSLKAHNATEDAGDGVPGTTDHSTALQHALTAESGSNPAAHASAESLHNAAARMHNEAANFYKQRGDKKKADEHLAAATHHLDAAESHKEAKELNTTKESTAWKWAKRALWAAGTVAAGYGAYKALGAASESAERSLEKRDRAYKDFDSQVDKVRASGAIPGADDWLKRGIIPTDKQPKRSASPPATFEKKDGKWVRTENQWTPITNDSFFKGCKRDDKGRCTSGSGSGASKSDDGSESGKPATPSEKQRWDADKAALDAENGAHHEQLAKVQKSLGDRIKGALDTAKDVAMTTYEKLGDTAETVAPFVKAGAKALVSGVNEIRKRYNTPTAIMTVGIVGPMITGGALLGGAAAGGAVAAGALGSLAFHEARNGMTKFAAYLDEGKQGVSDLKAEQKHWEDHPFSAAATGLAGVGTAYASVLSGKGATTFGSGGTGDYWRDKGKRSLATNKAGEKDEKGKKGKKEDKEEEDKGYQKDEEKDIPSPARMVLDSTMSPIDDLVDHIMKMLKDFAEALGAEPPKLKPNVIKLALMKQMKQIPTPQPGGGPPGQPHPPMGGGKPPMANQWVSISDCNGGEWSPVENWWSDEARQASLEARRKSTDAKKYTNSIYEKSIGDSHERAEDFAYQADKATRKKKNEDKIAYHSFAADHHLKAAAAHEAAGEAGAAKFNKLAEDKEDLVRKSPQKRGWIFGKGMTFRESAKHLREAEGLRSSAVAHQARHEHAAKLHRDAAESHRKKCEDTGGGEKCKKEFGGGKKKKEVAVSPITGNTWHPVSNDANFRSESQRRFMWSQHPDIAHKWAHGQPAGPANGPHRMPSGPGKDVKGPMAKAARKRKKKKVATTNWRLVGVN